MAMRVFLGNERFEVLSRLGSGGVGAVYHVIDRDRKARLALKTVGVVDGEKLLRFKREFRALQDLGHPNLISLGELFEVDGEWFYTMELVDGVDFYRHVRTDPKPFEVSHTMATEAPTSSRSGGDRMGTTTDGRGVQRHETARGATREADPLTAAPVATGLGFDEARLRSALAQLAAGLSALHRAGKVHRDVKPTNVLVTSTGRVVILDFGLVTDIKDGLQATDVGVMGTYPYMSPEQASGMPVDGRTDWYAMGTMLFQALTGRLPFPGKTYAALSAKLHLEAPEARDFEPGVPADLNDLCRDLLRRDPDERPSESEIFRRLHVEQTDEGQRAFGTQTSLGAAPSFVGRREELDELRTAFDLVLAQSPVSVLLTGESGIGKTELLERFLRDVVAASSSAIVLRGRCFERESVPFKSMDGVVDTLSSHLARLPEEAARRFVPHHPELLARAFPVLKRVGYFAEPRPLEIRDPQEQRARVFSAMRTLFQRLATRDPVILVIEDVQWLDEDSGSLLTEVLREPGAPPMLFVGAVRTDATGTLEAVAGGRLAAYARQWKPRLVHLGQLREEDGKALAVELLGMYGGELSQAAAIAKEAEGHPLFIEELARHADPERPLGGKLDDVLLERIRALPEPDRRILEVLAIAEGSLATPVLARVCEMEAEDMRRRVAALRVHRLLRMSGGRSVDEVELYHARTGTALSAPIDEATRQATHERIARALQAEREPDLVDLAMHLRGAGRTQAAALFAAKAAEQAGAALAFDRAAALFRTSLELAPEDGEGLEGRRLRLAEMLANAGHGKEAGEMYLDAVKDARPADAIDLRRRAAEQFLLSGHMPLGIETFKQVLGSLGIPYPERAFQVLFSIVWARIKLAIKGFKFKERDESLCAREDLLRIDACYSAGMGLTPTDTVRGFDFYGRALLHALRVGEPGRVAEHIAIEAVHGVTRNAKRRQKTFEVLYQARILANRVGTPRVRGVVTYSEGIAAYLTGEWRNGLEVLHKAEKLFREECVQAPGELRTVQACIVQCLWELGEWRELQERVSRAVKEARERGDLFTEATITAGHNLATHCMRDEAERGLEGAAAIIEGWSGTTFDVQRYMHLLYGSTARVYLGRHEEAYQAFVAEWPEARRSLLMQVQIMRAGAYHFKGLVTAAHAAQNDVSRKSLTKAVLDDATRMIREDAAWCQACGYLLKGSALALLGRVAEGVSWLDVGIAKCDVIGMQGRAMAGRWAKGALLGGSEGAALVATARAWMEQEGVRRPERFAPLLAPVLYAKDLVAIPLEA